MRVLDRTGRDAGVVGLGDELMLRIELKDQASNLAIFARNLYARSKNGESLFLIDSTGCPTDPSIFPALNLDARDRKSLFANFKAFRFPSTGLVNFEVQIRFCQDQCKTVRCSNNVESYGRKKRDIDNSPESDESTSLPSSDSRNNSTELPPTSNMQGHEPHKPHITPLFMDGNSINNRSMLSNVTEVFGTFRVISSTASPFTGNGVDAVRMMPNNWWNMQNNYPYRHPMNYNFSYSNPMSYNDPSFHLRQRGLMNGWQSAPGMAERWRYQTAVAMETGVSNELHLNSTQSGRQGGDRTSHGTRTTSNPRISKNTPKGNSLFTPVNYRPTYATSNKRFPSSYSPDLSHSFNAHSRHSTNSRNVASTLNSQTSRDAVSRKPFRTTAHQQRMPTSDRYYAYNSSPSAKKPNASSTRRSQNSSPSSTGPTPPSSLTTPELIISTMVPVPDELPLHLAIMVGEDPGVDVSNWKSNTKNINPTETAHDIDTVGLICTSVTTIAATAVTLSLVHVCGLVGAFCCYKWHRKSKRKKLLQMTLSMPPNPTTMRRTGGSAAGRRQEELFYAKPDVSFRNVYGSYESPP